MIRSAFIGAIVFALSFTAFPIEAAAQHGLCDPEWWRDSATASGVRMLAQTQNVDAVCPNTADGDYPIHLAVFFADDAGPVEALLQSGASMARSNAIGQTPATLLDIRLNAAVTLRLRTDAILAIEQLINRGTEAQNLAQNNLCSLEWWPTATYVSVRDAIHRGADPNQDCDEFGNKPIHIGMDLNVIPYPFSSENLHAIGSLVDHGGVVPDTKAVRLVEYRYTVVKIHYEESLRRFYDGNISRVEHRRNVMSSTDVALYVSIRDRAGVESEENGLTRTDAELNAISARVFNEYRQRLSNPSRR